MSDPFTPIDEPTPALVTQGSSMGWSAIWMGALIAAASIFVLTGFGSALGFGDLSNSWRQPSAWLALLSGVWFLVVAVGALALGGYIAGRLRAAGTNVASEETAFRDGTRGLASWALAILLGAGLSALTSVETAYDRGFPVDNGPVSSRSLGAPSAVLTLSLDRLLRSDRRPGQAEPALRDEAGRLLAEAVSDPHFPAEDHSQLYRDVSAATGLTAGEAKKRTDDTVTDARRRVGAARHARLIGGFITAASLLIGAIAAWLAAESGGKHRDSGLTPRMDWAPRRPRVVLRP